uniref:G-protein coupled receptors family 1 profile domain-containing protein n=1 Tax=Panagrolaimus sp. JU765 TaxID=591449 RepID=A0AC34RPL3_9BILA
MNKTNPILLGDEWNSPFSPIVQAIIWIVAFLLSLETVIGNAMVIIAYKLERSISKQVSNRYIVSLAVSDLIIGLEGIPLFTVYIVNGDRWPLGGIACETWLFLDYTLCLVSILTVLLITADRYLSVCHTAKYLKWQSPTKTQILIFMSWIFPAIMFGFMIYGWGLVDDTQVAYNAGECSAPFLSNPYVNMGMYLAYYWSTLVAMLILYKGIHQAAKNLEKKARAKEHRHIALLLTQRLGTQVGVSLMLQSRRNDSLQTDANKDSGYQTNNLSTAANNHSDELAPLEVIKESESPRKQIIRKQKLLEHKNSSKNIKLPKHPVLRSVKSATLAINQHEVVTPDDDKRFQKSNRRSKKWRKSEENIQNVDVNHVVNVTDENGQITKTVDCIVEQRPSPTGFFAIFRRKLSWFTRRPSNFYSQTSHRSRSSSASSSSSSSSDVPRPRQQKRKSTAPTVTITRTKTKNSIESFTAPERERSDPFLSAVGMSRKVSTLSSFTRDTRDRVLQSIFSPIIALNKGRRKQTKAEKRAHKAFRTITFIVGFFAILWSPYYVVATVYGFCKDCVPPLLYNLSYYMCYLNSSGNPFAYALANRQFRSAFLRMFHGNFKQIYSTKMFHQRGFMVICRRLHTSNSVFDLENTTRILESQRKRLFRVARSTKKTQTYDSDKIDEGRAMAEFDLNRHHLADLPKLADQFSHNTLYSIHDVYEKALKVHGSPMAIYAKSRPLLHQMSDAERMRLRMRVEARSSGTTGADRVVGIAFALNTCDMLFKFTAAYLTGSKSLFAEAIHSTMDTVNQLILFMGIRYSSRNADPNFPYGYGNLRYVTSLISGCGILSFGCGLSMYHGISGLLHPSALEPMSYAYYALGMSLCFQGCSAITAFREVRRKAEESHMSIIQYVRSSADPSLNVVLLEDTAAVTGVCVAFTAISLSSILDSSIPDCCGSIVIGCLLGTVASFIIRTNASHLVGRSLPKRITDDIICRLENDPMIRSVHDVKATSLGVEKSRFKAEIDFNGRAITQAYLKDHCNVGTLLHEVQSYKDPAEMEQFMLNHGEKIIDRVGDEVDRIERQITRKHPDIRHVDLEAL